jgi:glutaredoxin
MRYLFFSMPACPKCAAIKDYLKNSDIEGEENSLADPEGVIRLRKIYPQIKERIKRNEDGSLPIPTILFLDDSSNIVNTAHDLESVKRIVENRALV